MRIHSEYQLVDLFLDFQYAQTRYFELAPPDLPSHDLIDPGVELPHLPHDASSQQEISAAGTNASASGTSSAHNGYGIPESDLTSTPMILRVPEGVNPDDPNASDRLYDYTKMFKEEYDKRDDKTLEVSCLHCSRLQKVLRPSSLARHLCRHCEVKDYACDQCVKKCCTQQQLDRHKTNQHGVPAPEPKLVKIKVVKSKVVKSKVVKAKAAKAKAAKGKGAKH
ncbi:hypothetical protein FRC06_010445 [Ceratobasidium sp. 370]|nr:hypothetical protein FRC06_010445 [Ceratobasidium sp. 370]